MKDLKKETANMLANVSSGLVKVVGNASFEMWERKDFRLYIDFENLPQQEQDRIFNELQVSVLGLFILHLEKAAIDSSDEQKNVLSAIQKDLTPAFLNLFVDLKVKTVYVEQWRKLINLRLKEYRKDFEIALEESEKMNEFKDEEKLRIVWARIETITIDCLTHIRRGKVEEKDPLLILLRKWLIAMDAMLNPFTNPPSV